MLCKAEQSNIADNTRLIGLETMQVDNKENTSDGKIADLGCWDRGGGV